MDKNYLSALIDAGADAFSNLFTVDIIDTLNGENSLIASSTRIENFNAPEKSVTTTTLNYQNTFVNIPLPTNSSVNKTSTFRFRVDENYALYKYLKSLILLENYGDFSVEEFYKDSWINIVVTAYTSQGSKIHKWTFSRCRLVKVAEVTYEHSNSNVISLNVDFIWDSLEEESGPFNNN